MGYGGGAGAVGGQCERSPRCVRAVYPLLGPNLRGDWEGRGQNGGFQLRAVQCSPGVVVRTGRVRLQDGLTFQVNTRIQLLEQRQGIACISGSRSEEEADPSKETVAPFWA